MFNRNISSFHCSVENNLKLYKMVYQGETVPQLVYVTKNKRLEVSNIIMIFSRVSL